MMDSARAGRRHEGNHIVPRTLRHRAETPLGMRTSLVFFFEIVINVFSGVVAVLRVAHDSSDVGNVRVNKPKKTQEDM